MIMYGIVLSFSNFLLPEIDLRGTLEAALKLSASVTIMLTEF